MIVFYILVILFFIVLSIMYINSALQLRRKNIEDLDCGKNMISLTDNLLMSGERIEGYNRQQIVENNKPLYGVSNKGVTMDSREIYVPDYSSFGL